MNARAEILGKMDPTYTSDTVKTQIRDYKKREAEGKVERYIDSELYAELKEDLA